MKKDSDDLIKMRSAHLHLMVSQARAYAVGERVGADEEEEEEENAVDRMDAFVVKTVSSTFAAE